MAQFPNSTGPNSGVWTLEDVYNARIGGNWPTVFIGDPGFSNVIDYINFGSLANAVDFGDLTVARYGPNSGSVGSTTRGCFGGGGEGSPIGTTTIDYITFKTSGNALDFGDLTVSGRALGAGISSSTRGVFGPRRGAPAPGFNNNVFDYITIASTGNATDFGDATIQAANNAGACSSTRGLRAGGNLNNAPGGLSSNVVDYITIATTGNAIDFGDLTGIRNNSGGLSSSTRAIFAGGNANPGSSPYGPTQNNIDYFTITSIGNATDFGDLTLATTAVGISNETKGVFQENQTTPAAGSMSQITIASTGNAASFGDLSVARGVSGSGSSAHGGLT